MTIKDAIRKLVEGERDAGFGGSESVVCEVLEVNGMNCVCAPVNGAAEIQDVRLVADDTKDGFVLVPEVGSFVVVQMLNGTAGYLAMVSKITEVYYKVGTAQYNLNEVGHLVTKGEDTLKEALTLIVQAVQQIVVLQGNNPDYMKLTKALEKINNILR